MGETGAFYCPPHQLRAKGFTAIPKPIGEGQLIARLDQTTANVTKREILEYRHYSRFDRLPKQKTRAAARKPLK